MLDAALELWAAGHSPQAEYWGLKIEGTAGAPVPA